MKKTLLTFAIAGAMTSCMVTRTTVGSGPVGNDPTAKVYSKIKQGYVLNGLVPIGTRQVKLPETAAYQIKTSKKVGDALITGITFGIYTRQTIEVLVK